MTVIEHAQLRAILPHRGPILLLDRVTALREGVSLRALKAVTGSECCYHDIPEGAPSHEYAYPASLLLESFGQAAAVLWLTRSSPPGEPAGDGLLMFAAARDCVLHEQVLPGDVLRHEVRLEHVKGASAVASGETWVNDRLVATMGSFIAVRRPSPRPGQTSGRDRGQHSEGEHDDPDQ